MAITVELRSRNIQTDDKGGSADDTYLIRGTDDDEAALAALEAEAPSVFRGLVRTSVGIVRNEGTETFIGAVHYAPFEAQKKPGDCIKSFDTTGATTHITQAKEHLNDYAPSGETAPNHAGAIGVSDRGVDGCDVIVPTYSFGRTVYYEANEVDDAYSVTLCGLTAKTNDAAFCGFAAGEVLFLGASGSQRGDGTWEITYRFSASPNATNMTVANINNITKGGHVHLWVRYKDVEDSSAKCLVQKPASVHTDRVYDAANFGLIRGIS